MALLTEAQKDKVERVYQRLGLALGAYTKPTLSGAADDADGWADANAAAYNVALRAAYRNNATTAGKTALLALVILERAGLLDALVRELGD